MEQPNRRTFPWVLAIIIILLLVLGWHLVLPLLGLTLVVTAAAWGVVVATITVLSITIILFCFFGGVCEHSGFRNYWLYLDAFGHYFISRYFSNCNT
ncbi:hypothetical protein [Candidatus Coxiella mudrowiae]|uniref:hypothetical protein n=1 Tax=Candidatus Coxiella mudrowiae TaxID=2054173 RepID=UPI001F188856|nr:hypothetical protein [Candidatus Coxiella mudrowiae]